MLALAATATAAVLMLSPVRRVSGNKEEEITQKTAKSSEKAIIPKYNISDSYYKMVLPFGKARVLTADRLNTRLDIDEFETGLMRLAQDTFPTDDYLYQEASI